MKIFLPLFCALFCILSFGLNTAAQTENRNAEVAVEAVWLMRDDGAGKGGEATDVFLTTDTPIHCFIQLNSTEPATVKLILVAVRAAGLPPETKSIAVSFTTDGNQNQVNFNAKPEGAWASGSYRADIYINGTLSKSRNFEIEKPPKVAESKRPLAPKPLVSRKNIKKPRRN